LLERAGIELGFQGTKEALFAIRLLTHQKPRIKITKARKSRIRLEIGLNYPFLLVHQTAN